MEEFGVAFALVVTVAVVIGAVMGGVFAGITHWAEKARSPMGQAARTMAVVLAGCAVVVVFVMALVV